MTLRPCQSCGKAHHGDVGDLCKELPTRKAMLENQVDTLRYYLSIEHAKIADGQRQAKLLLKKLSQVRRHIKHIDDERMGN